MVDALPAPDTCAQLRTGGSLGFKGDFTFSEGQRARCVYSHLASMFSAVGKPVLFATDAAELYAQFLKEVPLAIDLNKQPIEHIDRGHSFDGFLRVALEISLLQRCKTVYYHKGSGYFRNSLFLLDSSIRILDTSHWQDGLCTKKPPQFAAPAPTPSGHTTATTTAATGA